MPAPKGHKKWGGRQKGVPNRNKQALLEICEEKGIYPFEGLLELCLNDDVHIRFNALKEVCQYCYPKKKAIEHSGNFDIKLVERIKELEAMPDEDLKKLAGK